MAFYKDERLALFIDGANLYTSARALGLEIDYRKLLSEFQSRGRLLRASYYTALVEGEDYSPIRPLVDWLTYNGFNVVTKPAREYTDRDGRKRVRGNMDVELAVDILKASDRLDHIVLFSGNGDFRRLVDEVKSRGVRVSVVSTLKTQPGMIADDLRRAADAFIDLQDLADLVARPRRENDDREHDFADDIDE
ncbi:MAG: NYN domain-containing protein [Pseudomonadota bacterium]